MSSTPPPPPFGVSPPPPPPFAPPFGGPAQPFPPGSEITPGTRWYWIAVGVGLVAVLVGVVLIVRSVMGFIDRIDDFQRVDVPGTETIHLEEGSYTVYVEGLFVGDDDTWSYSGGGVQLRDSHERLVGLHDYDGHTTYNVSSHEGLAILTFHADDAGDYRVTTTGVAGSIVAIGPGLGEGLVAGIGGGVLLIIAGGLFAVITIIVVAVKRGRARRRQFVQAFAPYPR